MIYRVPEKHLVSGAQWEARALSIPLLYW